MITVKNTTATIKFDTGAELSFDALAMRDKIEPILQRVADQSKGLTDEKKIANFMLEAIEELFGEDATAKIFQGVDVTPTRVVFVYSALVLEIRRKIIEVTRPMMDMIHKFEPDKTSEPVKADAIQTKHGPVSRIRL